MHNERLGSLDLPPYRCGWMRQFGATELPRTPGWLSYRDLGWIQRLSRVLSRPSDLHADFHD